MKTDIVTTPKGPTTAPVMLDTQAMEFIVPVRGRNIYLLNTG